MIFFFLTFPLALFYWLYLIRYRIKEYSSVFGFVTGASLLIYLSISIFLISFREIGVIDGIIYGGTDAPAYLSIYNSANIAFLDSLLVQFYEPGYATIVWFFSSYIGGYEIFQVFIYAFIYGTLYFYLKFFKPNGYLLVPILMLSFMVVSSLNILRVTVAIFIGFYVFYFLFKEKFFKAFLISILAVSVHTSAIFLLIMLAFYLLFNKLGKINYWSVYLLFLALLFIASFFVLPGLLSSHRLGVYNENEGEFSLNTFIVASIVIFLTFNRYKAFVDYSRFNKTLIAILPTIFFVLPIFYNYPIGYRFLLYYLPIVFLLLPSIFYIYNPVLKKNLIYFPLLFALSFYVVIKIYLFFTIGIKHSKVFSINLTGLL